MAVDSALLDGMWVRNIESVKGPEGNLTHVRIAGYGFPDELKKYKMSAEETPLDRFCDNLVETEAFVSTKIEVGKLFTTKDKIELREYAVSAELKSLISISVEGEENE